MLKTSPVRVVRDELEIRMTCRPASFFLHALSTKNNVAKSRVFAEEGNFEDEMERLGLEGGDLGTQQVVAHYQYALSPLCNFIIE